MPHPLLRRLLPQPLQATVGDRLLELPRSPVILARPAAGPLTPAVEWLEECLAALGLSPRRAESGAEPGRGVIRLTLEGGDDPQAYRLLAGAEGVLVAGGGEAGAFYGAATLGQWLRLAAADGHAPGAAPSLAVDDHPALATRGVMLDVSRDKVPTLETTIELVDRLASWKINQLQLYMEHTFAYRGHEEVWRDASPWTPEEVRALDRHCARRCVELVPNQNSFGHFHRWLRHDAYRPLAECPAGVVHPWSPEPEPFSLCPTDPRTLLLLEDLWDQLLPLFSSRQVNVGLDETFDLGRGRSARACGQRGRSRVYLDFLRQVHDRIAARSRRMQYWGDVVLEHPESIPELPDDALALVWGYEADHPFDDQARRFARAGLPFLLCPGTSTWCSLAGRASNAVSNLSAAALAAGRHGAEGLLITDWGDFGHPQPLAVAWAPLLHGAAVAWSAGTAGGTRPTELAAALEDHVLGPGTGGVGGAALSLAEAWLLPGPRPRNRSALFQLLWFPHRGLDHPTLEGLSTTGLGAVRHLAAQAGTTLEGARPATREGQRSVAELAWVAGALDLAAEIGSDRLALGGEGRIAELPAARRRRLLDRLEALRETQASLWLARNRPGGLADARRRLDPLAAALAGLEG